jgi:hypothetical protein
MREVALLTFDGHQIASLREYWASEVAALSPAATHSPGTVTGRTSTADDHRCVGGAGSRPLSRCK